MDPKKQKRLGDVQRYITQAMELADELGEPGIVSALSEATSRVFGASDGNVWELRPTATTQQHERVCLSAMHDVRDLIWPPGFDRPDDEALAAESAVLREIMARLAFLKPHQP